MGRRAHSACCGYTGRNADCVRKHSSHQGVKNSTKHVESAPITDHIQTSRLRNNALHDYEEGYRPITAVICLMDTDEYKILDEDDWQDYRLKLAVHEDEEEGWLILVYESGKVCKVSIAELLQRERGRAFKRYAGENSSLRPLPQTRTLYVWDSLTARPTITSDLMMLTDSNTARCRQKVPFLWMYRMPAFIM